MEIRNNTASLRAQRALGEGSAILSRARERLASGLRVVRASDDAAGLAIAEGLNADIRLATQSIRNVKDGLSMLSIADGALEQITSVLTRGAELADQAANGVYGPEQKRNLDLEAQALVQEIDRIAATTTFNGLKILQTGGDPFATEKQQILLGLQTTWLEQAEQLIQTYYGITGDGATLTVDFTNNSPQYLAAVTGNVDVNGKTINQTLLIDIADFVPATLPNGGTAPYYNDRIIAHEMVHAVMGRAMNMAALPTWFIEGTAEFIHGADERLAGDITLNGGFGTGGEDAVQNEIDQPWTGSSLQYSAGYAAVRYLHDRIIGAGGAGIADIMAYLDTNETDDLNDALQNITFGSYVGGLSGAGGFYQDYKTLGNGSVFIQSMNLLNADTGAIGGADADGGGRPTTATTTVPDINNFTLDPLNNFAELYPTIDTSNGTIEFAVGLNGQDYLGLTLININTEVLGVENVNLVNYAAQSLDNFKAAIQTVTEQRAKIGATLTRFQAIVSNLSVMGENFSASRSRIMDVDVAEESAVLARATVMTEAAAAVLAQANVQPQIALQLLQDS